MKNFLLVSALFLLGCRSAPFKVGSISPKTTSVSLSEKRDLDAGIAERYKKAKKPSFALISGFYSLPSTKPYGAAGVVDTFSYQLYFEVNTPKPYAIEPMAGDDAQGRERALNKLLDAGVKIKEISMSDAQAIAKAENKAQKDKQIFKPNQILSPDVDYLMSIYQANSKEGPLLVGRVIKNDGTLLAFRAVDHGEVDKLIVSLFEDTISRIGQ